MGTGYIWDGVGAGLGVRVEVPENKLKPVRGAIEIYWKAGRGEGWGDV